MTVLIIGVVTMTALVWILGVSLANESDAERRQAVRESHHARRMNAALSMVNPGRLHRASPLYPRS